MKLELAVITSAMLMLTGCEKAKGLLDDFGSGSSAGEDVKTGGKVDGDLAGQVQREGDGVKFRKDLPFPRAIEVRMGETAEFKGARQTEESALGRSASALEEKRRTEAMFTKQPGTFALKLEKMGRLRTQQEEKKGVAAADPGRSSELEGEIIEFALTEAGWRTRQRSGALDFKKVVWADALEDQLVQIMVEAGTHPRSQWFSSSRSWRKGDRVVLTGNALKILDPFDVSGRVELTFEGEEAVEGHPCGVFLVSGNKKVVNRPWLDGSHCDSEVTITAGKIWASLLYPIILCEEYDTVQSLVIRDGGRGGPERRIQGTVIQRKTRDWSAVEPAR